MNNLNFEKERIEFTPVIYFINYINLIHNNHLKEKFKNITPRDFTYLSNIFYHRNISQKELAEMLFVSESNVTQIINRLEKNGYVIRENDYKNKSRKILNLTNEGRLVLFSLLKIIFEFEGKFFENYTEKLWGRHPREISPEWGKQRVKGLSIFGIMKDIFLIKVVWNMY